MRPPVHKQIEEPERERDICSLPLGYLKTSEASLPLWAFFNHCHTVSRCVLTKKMRILSLTHPHVVSNLYGFLLLNTKEDILKNVGDS